MAAVNILNIQIDVHNWGTFEMEELKHKLTIYARNFIDVSNKSKKQPIPQQQSANEDLKYF